MKIPIYLYNPAIDKFNENEVISLDDMPFHVGGYIGIIKNGTTSDGASIPRFAWRIIGCPFTGKYTFIAYWHDKMYAAEVMERDIIDDLFYEGMLYYGVEEWRAYSMYKAVRVGGGRTWDRHTDESIKEAKDRLIMLDDVKKWGEYALNNASYVRGSETADSRGAEKFLQLKQYIKGAVE